MRYRFNWSAIIVWFLCGAACLGALISLGNLVIQRVPSENAFKLIGEVFWILFAVPFAITAALIVSRQRGNVIGWLLMAPAILSIISAPIDSYLKSVTTPPAVPGFLFLVMAWFSNWSWLVLIFPLLLIPLLFPTGRPPSVRWRWVLIAAGILIASFIWISTFSKTLGQVNNDWSVLNPLGFLDDSFIQTFMVFWAAGLMVMILSSFGSLFVRYRHAGSMEREQIKWLLYACALFAVIYIPGFWINNLGVGDSSIAANLFNLLFGFSILSFPAAIAIAILRYRLYDIDLIIRRTLQYGLLSVLLGLVYFGMVVLLEQAFRVFSGQNSPLVVVLSTLAIVVLFNPLRRRLQAAIDRRFYRQKYDADYALEEFSTAARREVELEQLTSQMVSVVERTVSPDGVWLWMRNQYQSDPPPSLSDQEGRNEEGRSSTIRI